MNTITILNLNEYKKQPIPEVGKVYHIFDDGKIKPSRHYIAKILELVPFEECQDAELINAWKHEVEECYWLYATETDYFVKAESDFDELPLYFARTEDGGWFSLDYPGWWRSARLDADGSLYQWLIEQYGGE